MNKYKYIDQLPQPLKDSILQNRCLPIIGSGFSINAITPEGKSMPDWNKLGKAFADEMPSYQYSNTLDAISAYEHAFSRPSMVEKMKEHLLSGYVKPGGTHESFCKLQFDIVCTTNFDHILEEGYVKISKPCRPIVSESQLSVAPMKDELTLLKFHGDIDYPDTLVATEGDYDKFVNDNPLLATYLSSLLITRTPLFIGYSLDDEDFRQLWQIIKNRLGRMVRQAFVIKVGCSITEKARFERRGVSVINLSGSPEDYKNILRDLFDEIKDYWDENLKTTGDNISLSELALPKGTQTSLCYFSAPYTELPLYKDVLFPIAQEYGFNPITTDSVFSIGDNIMAKVSSLISKIDYFVVDIGSPNTLFEFNQIVSMNKIKENVLVIRDKDYTVPDNSYTVINKTDIITEDGILNPKIEKWFNKNSLKVRKNSQQETIRLLEKKEYKAAFIAAVVQLETCMREVVEKSVNTNDSRFKTLFMLTDIAYRNKIISRQDLIKLRGWMATRNKLVHSDAFVGESESKTIEDILNFIAELQSKYND